MSCAMHGWLWTITAIKYGEERIARDVSYTWLLSHEISNNVQKEVAVSRDLDLFI